MPISQSVSGRTGGAVDSVTGNIVDNTDPANPVVSLTSANFGSFSNGLTGKTTPVDADSINIVDSAAANVAKKVTWANVKATLLTYFDTLYVKLTGDQTIIGRLTNKYSSASLSFPYNAWNPNTTDNNGTGYSHSIDTTGAGASTNYAIAYAYIITTDHNHATMTAEYSIGTTIGGLSKNVLTYNSSNKLTSSGSLDATGNLFNDYKAHVNAYTKQQNFTALAITSTAGSIAWNLDDAQFAKHAATENTTLATPTNMKDGGTYILRWVQNASAAKTLLFSADYIWEGATPTVSAVLSSVAIFTFTSDGSKMRGSMTQYPS